CTDCGGTVIEYDATAGNGFCVSCGTVVEENTIVNEVTFGETSTGAAMVQGAYVAQGATHARMGGPFGNRGSNESREQTIANANRKIVSIANILRLSETVSHAATRLYTLAVEHKFTKGRKSLNVVAVCLYVACRQKETRNYMLIDFSDLLQVNVFELGHTYLQLVQTLNLRLPLVDPSHYISRFAALLEFGDETHKVATDAIRLVQRFDRDWMTKGRRPAGVCGACLLLAARMNNFRRSVEEIVQVVKIADTTLRKRLEEFKNTPSGALTLTDFRTVWLEEEMDPPAFIKGKEKERAEAAKEGEEEDATGKKRKRKKGGKRKRKRRKTEGSDDEAGGELDDGMQTAKVLPEPARPFVDPALFAQGILAGTTDGQPLFFPDPTEQPTLDLEDGQDKSDEPMCKAQVEESPLEASVSAALAEEVAIFLQNEQGAQLADALNEADERRQAQMEVVDELLGLNEEELDAFILTEAEAKIKERVWVEMNREYLETIAARGEQRELGAATKSRKACFLLRRKSTNKPRDASTPHGSTAAESVRNLLKKSSKYSKRINYDALKGIFADEDGKSGDGDLPKLYTFDDDKDEEHGDAEDYVVDEGVVEQGRESEKEDGPWGEETYEQEV
ncbi:cyclin-like protein, partial [Vararia minispora EC-137]